MEKLSQGVNPIDGTPVPEGDLTRNARMSRCFAYVAQVLDKVVTNTAARVAKTQPSAPKAAPAPSPAPAQPQPENRPNALPPELAAMLRPASSIKPAPRKQPQTEPETPAGAQPSAAAEEAPHRLPISIPYNRRADFDYSEQPIAAAEVVRRLNALADETGGRLVCTHLLDWLTDAGLLAWMPDIHNKLSRLPTQSGEEVGILLTRCADYKDEHNVMYVPMDVPEEITPLCWLPFFQMTACQLTDDLDRWNKHPLQRAMEKFVSSKSANYVNSPFSEDTPGRA